MMLCVTPAGRDLNSRVDERFGRADYFLIIDTETMSAEINSNTAQAAGRGAGIGAAQIIADKGADALLTGVVGPNAFQSLALAGIRIYEGVSSAETVKEAIEKFKKGRYKKSSGPSGSIIPPYQGVGVSLYY
jgi:predicted Fe-Mo cluster-binding NifX family protein